MDPVGNVIRRRDTMAGGALHGAATLDSNVEYPTATSGHNTTQGARA